MSKETIANFIRAVAEQPELNKKLSAVPSDTHAWVEAATAAGFRFSKGEFVEFVEQVTGKTVQDNAVALLREGDAGSEAGGFAMGRGGQGIPPSIRFSPNLFQSIGNLLGHPGDVGAYHTKTGPIFSKDGAVANPGKQFGAQGY